jgi:hypothetical protein
MTLEIGAETSLFSAFTPQMPIAQNPRCPTLYWKDGPTAVICGTNLTNVAVIGAGMNTSVLDGGGWPWYKKMFPNGFPPAGKGESGLEGPRLFELAWSKNVTLAHVKLINTAGWTVHPTYCDGVHVHHIHILNPRFVGNTDGFDPDSCTDVVRLCMCFARFTHLVVKENKEIKACNHPLPSLTAQPE